MDSKFTKACDVFSLGVTLLELATDLDLPHDDDNEVKNCNDDNDAGESSS